MKYIPLNVKTEYDLMNSLIKIDELISYCKENKIDYHIKNKTMSE